jgi:hypothetical protein
MRAQHPTQMTVHVRKLNRGMKSDTKQQKQNNKSRGGKEFKNNFDLN